MLFPLKLFEELTDEGLRELQYQVEQEIERREGTDDEEEARHD